MEIERGVFITWNLWRAKGLTISEKVLLIEIQNISELKDKIATNNSYFSKLMGIKKQAVSRLISSLLSGGFIEIQKYSDEESFRYLNKKNSGLGCLFCGYDGISIDKHHYPIRNKDGGTETIKLCANCHREFHNLADHNGGDITINYNNLSRDIRESLSYSGEIK